MNIEELDILRQMPEGTTVDYETYTISYKSKEIPIRKESGESHLSYYKRVLDYFKKNVDK